MVESLQAQLIWPPVTIQPTAMLPVVARYRALFFGRHVSPARRFRQSLREAIANRYHEDDPLNCSFRSDWDTVRFG